MLRVFPLAGVCPGNTRVLLCRAALQEQNEGPVSSLPRPQASQVTASAEVTPTLGEDPQFPSLNKGIWLKNDQVLSRSGYPSANTDAY